MSTHTNISRQEAADRPAIRELVEAYVFCADSANTNGQMDRIHMIYEIKETYS